MIKRFKDVVYKDVRLKNGDKVILFVPHTSEYIAVTPLLSKLSVDPQDNQPTFYAKAFKG